MSPRLLVIEGNPTEERLKVEGRGGQPDSTAFKRVLQHWAPAATVDVVLLPKVEAAPGPERLAGYSGAVWTGSALSVNAEDEIVSRARATMNGLIAARVPCFGSCWGLQLACVVLGGVVRPAVKGRQTQVERSIRLVGDGSRHPLFQDKPHAFQAVQIHADEIGELPPGATALATSDSTPVEAAALDHAGWRFWGTQYHPEFGVGDLGVALEIDAPALVEAGKFGAEADVELLARRLREGSSDALQRELGLDATVLDPDVRALEIRNWLRSLG